jgi:D-alanine--poly(phosphoribitol) ligase subunit 2
MNIEEVITELRGFIRDHFRIPENDPDFNDDIDLFNYGYVDSFGTVELARFVEVRFSIKLTESDWVGFPLATIREIASFVSRRKKMEI